MSSTATLLLSFNLIALGFLGIILSFLVTDRKKSLISLFLGSVIVFVGLFQMGTQSFTQMQINRRMKELQRQQQVDVEQLREKLKNQSLQAAPVTPAKK